MARVARVAKSGWVLVLIGVAVTVLHGLASIHRDPITLRVERANSLRSRSLIRVCTTVSLLYFLYLRACTRVAAALIGYVI